jgi:hypothetical protein
MMGECKAVGVLQGTVGGMPNKGNATPAFFLVTELHNGVKFILIKKAKK